MHASELRSLRMRCIRMRFRCTLVHALSMELHSALVRHAWHYAWTALRAAALQRKGLSKVRGDAPFRRSVERHRRRVVLLALAQLIAARSHSLHT